MQPSRREIAQAQAALAELKAESSEVRSSTRMSGLSLGVEDDSRSQAASVTFVTFVLFAIPLSAFLLHRLESVTVLISCAP